MIERDGETVRIYEERWKTLLWVVFGAAMTAGGYFAYRFELQHYFSTEFSRIYVVLFWMMMIAGPFGTIFQLGFLIFKKRIVEIDATGLKVARGIFSARFVPWNHILKIKAISIPVLPCVGVEIKSEYLSQNAVEQFTMAIFGCHIPIQDVKLPGDVQMLELLTARWRAASSEPALEVEA